MKDSDWTVNFVWVGFNSKADVDLPPTISPTIGKERAEALSADRAL
jgi:hypothetical protein